MSFKKWGVEWRYDLLWVALLAVVAFIGTASVCTAAIIHRLQTNAVEAQVRQRALVTEILKGNTADPRVFDELKAIHVEHEALRDEIKRNNDVIATLTTQVQIRREREEKAARKSP